MNSFDLNMNSEETTSSLSPRPMGMKKAKKKLQSEEQFKQMMEQNDKLIKDITKGTSERNEIQRQKVEVAKMKEENKILFADLSSIIDLAYRMYIENERKRILKKRTQTNQPEEHREGSQYQNHGSQYQASQVQGEQVTGEDQICADASAVQQAVQNTVEAFGRLDILVNNAGVLAVAPVAEFDLAEFDRMLAVNVRSVFVASQAAAPHLGQGGRIINIGSTNAERMPFAGGAPYAMSKSALVGLTKGLARDLGPQGVTVNNVQPGPVDTDMNPADGDFADSLIPLMAVGRYGHAEEIASFVAYLAGPEAGYITGASLTADGGFSA